MKKYAGQHRESVPALEPALVRGRPPPAYRDLPRAGLRAAIEGISVDGRPAHPEFGPRRIRRLLLALVGLIVTTGVGVALLADPAMGLAFGVIGTLLFVAVNPEFWATMFRVRERRDARRKFQTGASAAPVSGRRRPDGVPVTAARSASDEGFFQWMA